MVLQKTVRQPTRLRSARFPLRGDATARREGNPANQICHRERVIRRMTQWVIHCQSPHLHFHAQTTRVVCFPSLSVRGLRFHLVFFHKQHLDPLQRPIATRARTERCSRAASCPFLASLEIYSSLEIVIYSRGSKLSRAFSVTWASTGVEDSPPTPGDWFSRLVFAQALRHVPSVASPRASAERLATPLWRTRRTAPCP